MESDRRGIVIATATKTALERDHACGGGPEGSPRGSSKASARWSPCLPITNQMPWAGSSPTLRKQWGTVESKLIESPGAQLERVETDGHLERSAEDEPVLPDPNAG